jgi:hypothetical protein
VENLSGKQTLCGWSSGKYFIYDEIAVEVKLSGKDTERICRQTWCSVPTYPLLLSRAVIFEKR